MNILSRLLLLPPYLRLCGWQIEETNTQINLTIVSIQAMAYCPICHQAAHRIHSHYERTLADLPWSEYGVSWQLRVRKFFCTNPDCQRLIFTERLPEVVEPWARKTCRLAQGQTLIARALGGLAGTRLSQALGYSTSRLKEFGSRKSEVGKNASIPNSEFLIPNWSVATLKLSNKYSMIIDKNWRRWKNL